MAQEQSGQAKLPGKTSAVNVPALFARKSGSQKLVTPARSRLTDRKPIATSENYYVFTGRGSWFTASNWKDNLVPPAVLKSGDHVTINGNGPCLLSNAKPFLVGDGSFVEIKEGKQLYVSIGNNFVVTGGTLLNNGKLTVLSGVLLVPSSEHVAEKGELRTTAMSKIAQRKDLPKQIRKN